MCYPIPFLSVQVLDFRFYVECGVFSLERLIYTITDVASPFWALEFALFGGKNKIILATEAWD